MDFHGSAFRRGHQDQLAELLGLAQRDLLVARLQTTLPGLDPDLQKVNRLARRPVELAVRDAGARCDPLQLAGAQRLGVTHAVLMRQLAAKHVGEDLHIVVAMRAEARARRHPVLIDHAKRPEAHMFPIEIIREGKAVIAVQPAVIGVTAFLTFTNRRHAATSNLSATVVTTDAANRLSAATSSARTSRPSPSNASVEFATVSCSGTTCTPIIPSNSRSCFKPR